MKGLLAVAALLAFSATMTAQAETVTLVEGDIAVGNPLGKAVGGVSEVYGVCTADTTLNGIDGITFDVPEDAVGREATLTTTGATAIDADVYFLDSAGGYISPYTMANNLEANERGTVPDGAVCGVVDLTIGAQAHVKLTYDRP